MAKAEAVVTVDSYQLTLTEEEAQALFVVLNRIIGSYNGPRKNTNGIWDALSWAGLEYDTDWFRKLDQALEGGTLRFEEL